MNTEDWEKSRLLLLKEFEVWLKKNRTVETVAASAIRPPEKEKSGCAGKENPIFRG